MRRRPRPRVAALRAAQKIDPDRLRAAAAADEALRKFASAAVDLARLTREESAQLVKAGHSKLDRPSKAAVGGALCAAFSSAGVDAAQCLELERPAAYVELQGQDDPRIAAIRSWIVVLASPGADAGDVEAMQKAEHASVSRRAEEIRKQDSKLSKSDATAQAIREQRVGR